MPLGPYDSRKKRFRCKSCMVKHVKCSGTIPCNHCQKRGLDCIYPAPEKKQFDIIIDKSSQKIISNYTPALRRMPIDSPKIDPQYEPNAQFFGYWDVFLQTNTFSRQGILSFDVKEAVRHSSSEAFLRQSVLAVGALTATKLSPQNRQVNYRLALTFYTEAVASLRDAINYRTESPGPQLAILWTTMLLGLFELMTDSSGQRWVQHLVHGTSRALVATGPDACADVLSQRFFTEIKIFEVCRAIVFNESSFLMQDNWKEFSKAVQSNLHTSNPHPFDELLDIILDCASLRCRAGEFITTLRPSSSSGNSKHSQPHAIAAEGFRLRDTLNLWQAENNQQSSEATFLNQSSAYDDFKLLASIFQAATSIYLSGVFDYEIHYWIDLGVLVPTLTENDVQTYVQSILELVRNALDRAKISAVLLLFPLRVAGARSRSLWQRRLILTLLERIKLVFSAAGAFKADLEYLWKNMEQDDDELEEWLDQGKWQAVDNHEIQRLSPE